MIIQPDQRASHLDNNARSLYTLSQRSRMPSRVTFIPSWAPSNPTPEPAYLIAFVLFKGMKHATPISPSTHEVKSMGSSLLTDTKAHIVDPNYPFSLADLCYEIFADHVRNKDPFRVVASEL